MALQWLNLLMLTDRENRLQTFYSHCEVDTEFVGGFVLCRLSVCLSVCGSLSVYRPSIL
jgi:hypothetical protein